MRRLVTRTLPSIAMLVVVAGCGAAPASPTPAPSGASPAAVLASPSPVPAPATPTSSKAATPSPAALVLGGTWVSPKAGARLTSYSTTLAAKPTAPGPGVATVSRVVFAARWPGAKARVVCTATEPDAAGRWACKAPLLELGVPPGKVTFSFDVHGAGVPAARSPDGARKVTYAVPPPRPTRTASRQLDVDSYDAYVYRVTWSAPAGYADEFLVYETYECPRPSTRRNANKPCFVPGTPVDVSQLDLLARVPGDARSAKVRSTVECFPSSILLRARNAYGNSVFAIVTSAPVIWIDPDSNETIC